MSTPPPYGPPPYGPPPYGPPADWQGPPDPAYGPSPQGGGYPPAYGPGTPGAPYGQGPAGYGHPAGQPPPYGPGGPYYAPPQRKSRALPWILGTVATIVVVAVAITAAVLVTRKVTRKPDLTALTSAMTATEGDFPSLTGAEFSAEPVDSSPEYEAMDVTPTACEYLVSYPKPVQTVSARVASDTATVAVYLQIDDARPDLQSALEACDGKTLRSGDNRYQVTALTVRGLPSWAVADTLTYDNSTSGGGTDEGSNNVIGGYHRGIYVEAWSSAATTDVSATELVDLFNAQVDRLDQI